MDEDHENAERAKGQHQQEQENDRSVGEEGEYGVKDRKQSGPTRQRAPKYRKRQCKRAHEKGQHSQNPEKTSITGRIAEECGGNLEPIGVHAY